MLISISARSRSKAATAEAVNTAYGKEIAKIERYTVRRSSITDVYLDAAVFNLPEKCKVSIRVEGDTFQLGRSTVRSGYETLITGKPMPLTKQNIDKGVSKIRAEFLKQEALSNERRKERGVARLQGIGPFTKYRIEEMPTSVKEAFAEIERMILTVPSGKLIKFAKIASAVIHHEFPVSLDDVAKHLWSMEARGFISIAYENKKLFSSYTITVM